MNSSQTGLPDLEKILSYYMNALWAMGALYVVLMLFMLAFTLVNFVYTITTLVRAIRSESADKTMWVLVIILVPVIGWILYRVLTREQAFGAYPTPVSTPASPVVTRSAPTVFVHPICRPAQTQAVADSVQAAMDEMVRQRRAERAKRV